MFSQNPVDLREITRIQAGFEIAGTYEEGPDEAYAAANLKNGKCENYDLGALLTEIVADHNRLRAWLEELDPSPLARQLKALPQCISGDEL